MKQITEIPAPQDRKVTITDKYNYAQCMQGMTGIITRITPEGANIWLPINQGGSYFDSIYWFPFNCFEFTNN